MKHKMRYVLPYTVLQTLLFALKHFEKGIPNRWKCINEYMLGCKKSKSCTLKVIIGEGNGKELYVDSFDEKILIKLNTLIVNNYTELLEKPLEWDIFFTEVGNNRDGFKCVLLKCPMQKCCICGNKLTVISTPSFPLVFTEHGTYVGASYTSECRTCINKPRFNASFFTTNDDGRQTRTYNMSNEYFLSSSQTCFSKRYLDLCSREILYMGATFDALADVYNSHNAIKDLEHMCNLSKFQRGSLSSLLNSQRLEEAWFLYRISQLFPVGLPVESKESGLVDIERICRLSEKKFEELQYSWLYHVCEVKGCKEGYVTIDGNEKLRRSICAESGEKLITEEGLKIQDCCPEDPVFGGKFKKPDKYCEEHKKDVEVDENVEKSIGDLEKRPSRKRILPMYLKDYDNYYNEESVNKIFISDSSTRSCKDKDKLNKFYKSSAGMLFLIRPCGTIVGFKEMFSHESLTQVFLFLRKLFISDERIKERIKYLGYDRSCELHPFICKLSKQGVEGAAEILEKVEFLVDIFHVLKHTMPSCMPLKDNPNCKYHPKLEKFKEIHGCNTESCEQAFKKLNRFKYGTRHMTRHKRMVFFTLLNNDHNNAINKM